MHLTCIMRRIAGPITAVCLTYATAIVVWQALRLLAGDRWWWLAVVNTLSLYLFLPVAILAPLALLSRRRAAILATLVPLFIWLLLFGGLFLPGVSAGTEGDEVLFRVMTLNVLFSNNEGAAVERLVREEQPDVICLQELTPRIAADLEVRLQDTHPYRVLAPEEGTTGVGVFSRYPLQDEGELPDPAEQAGRWRNGAHVMTVDVGGRPVKLLNIHAAPPPSDISHPHWFENFETVVQLREQELDLWMDWAGQQDEPLVAAGDFNLTDQNAGYRLVAARLNDAHRRAGWGWGHTWQADRRGYAGLPLPSRLLRLDYVWYSDHWRAVDAHVGAWDGQSDHLPVVATLALSDAR